MRDRVTPLPWDSEFFGIPIARVVIEDGDVARAVEDAAEQGAQCLYVVIPEAHPLSLVEAIRLGGRLVDLRMTFDLDAKLSAPRDVRVAGEGDRTALIPLTRSLSRSSRFSSDPRFAPDAVAAMYEIWLDRCLRSGVVVVPRDGVRGFVGLELRGDEASIELVYVDPEARGMGLAARLVRGALGTSPGHRARVATQAWNAAARRLYQDMGFRITTLEAIVHVWLDEVDQQSRATAEATAPFAGSEPSSSSTT